MSEHALKVKDIIAHLESVAPLVYQENYDNAGLLTGHSEMPVKGVLVTLDCTEAVVDEALARGCNLIVAHHPIIFGGLKKLNGKNYVERTVIKAIRNEVAIYAIHTNLDNVHHGVNRKIAERIGLKHTRVLAPKNGLLKKLATYVPAEHTEKVKKALFTAGAGHIGNYDECSFYTTGKGSFRGNDETHPFAGQKNVQHTEDENRLEVIFPAHIQQQVLAALIRVHPYEEVAYDIYTLDNYFEKIGAGMIGELPAPLEPEAFLQHLKSSMELGIIRYTPVSQPVRTVAVCGGAGSFLLKTALSQKADAFVTADFKYHEFFDAENRLMIADIGHYESEIFTKDLLRDIILEKFPTFAVLLAQTNTNPINYF